MLLELNSGELCEVCVNMCNIIMGVGAEHFLRGNCGNRDITKKAHCLIPWRGKLFLAIDQTQVSATMRTND